MLDNKFTIICFKNNLSLTLVTKIFRKRLIQTISHIIILFKISFCFDCKNKIKTLDRGK